MAAPPTEADLTGSATTIDSLPAEILAEVLLRLPTPAALVHAAAASRSWRGAIATTDFLARYRKRHKSSPFLGLYVPRQFAGPPSFNVPDSIRLADDDARDLKDAALRAFDFGEIRRYQDHRLHDAVGDAFIFGRLRVHPDCRLLDCHNSRLLLTRGDEALEVRSPLARYSILLPFPPDVLHPNSFQASLLQGHDKAAASFRVVCLQHHREGRKRQVRAVEYDSSRKSWQDHPWKSLKSNIEGTPEEVMHAGHRIFCRYTGLTSPALLLDTSNMQFSLLPLPSNINFTIGEIEDNACCFVESVGCTNHSLRVWQLDEEKLDWELKKDIKMNQVLGEHVGYYRPRAISNGIALVCSITTHHHFVVDLNTCRMKEKFEFHGWSAYPMQMPWPPAFSDLTANAMNPGSSEDGNNENQHELRDGAAPLNYMPSNKPQYLDIQDPTTTAPTPAAGEQCLVKDKDYDPNDYLIPDLYDQFSDVMHPEVIGSHHPERRKPMIRLEQGARCHPKYCIKDPELPDEVQIATSCSREASEASTVSSGESKFLFSGSGSTIKFPDAGKEPIIDVSITSASSLSDVSAGESAEQRGEVARDCAGGELGGDVLLFCDGGCMPLNEPRDLDIQEPTATTCTTATEEQCFVNDKNYVPNDYLLCDQFSELMNSKAAGGFDLDGGPAFVGDPRTGSRESHAIEGLFCGTLATAPAASPAVESEEPLLRVCRSRSVNHDLLLQPPTLASCQEQGSKQAGSRESKGSLEAMGPGRRTWKPKPKFLEAIFALRGRHSFSIASKISDEVEIATSRCSEASEASTDAVSAAEYELLFGGSGSTIKFTDLGKQPTIDVSITSAPSLSDPSAGESAEQRGEAAQDCAGGKLGRDVCAPMPSNEPQDLEIQEPTATARTPATEEQCFVNDKNYVPNEITDRCGQFSDLVHSEAAGGFDLNGGPAFVGDLRTGSGKSDAIEGLFCGTLAMAPAAAPAVESEEPLLRVRRSRSLNHDLLLQPPTLASFPEQASPAVEPLLLQPPTLASCPRWDAGRFKRRQVTDRGRRQKMPNPKYLGGDWLFDNDWCEQ